MTGQEPSTALISVGEMQGMMQAEGGKHAKKSDNSGAALVIRPLLIVVDPCVDHVLFISEVRSSRPCGVFSTEQSAGVCAASCQIVILKQLQKGRLDADIGFNRRFFWVSERRRRRHPGVRAWVQNGYDSVVCVGAEWLKYCDPSPRAFPCPLLSRFAFPL